MNINIKNNIQQQQQGLQQQQHGLQQQQQQHGLQQQHGQILVGGGGNLITIGLQQQQGQQQPQHPQHEASTGIIFNVETSTINAITSKVILI